MSFSSLGVGGDGEPDFGGAELGGGGWGQSGWPASPHYADLLPGWMENTPLPMTPTLAADAPAFTLAPQAP